MRHSTPNTAARGGLRFALAALLAAFAIPAPALRAAPGTAFDVIVVDPGGGGHYTTIQAAIDNALAGDTILVSAGVYVEELVVDVSVTIAGAGIGQTVVRPATSVPGSGPGSQLGTTTWLARVRASGVTLSAMTFDGDNPTLPAAVDARGGIVTDFTAGTFNALQVLGCEVKNVAYRGIYAAAGGSGHKLNSNKVSNVKAEPLDSVGIFFFGAVGEARGNNVTDCSIALGFQSGGGGLFRDNVVSACDLGMLANGSTSPVNILDNTVTASDQGIQSIAVSTTVTVSGNATSGCLTGLTLFGLGTGNVVVDDNTFDGLGAAGSSGLFASTDVSPFGFGPLTAVVTNTRFLNNEVGVALEEAAGNNAPVLGLTLGGSRPVHNTFSGNSLFNVELIDCNDDVSAQYNAWSAASAAQIELTLYHQPDDPLLGLIDFANPVNDLIVVDDDGFGDFLTINPAVQALQPGGTILVLPGLYVEDVVVDRSCIITGAGTDPDPSLGTVLRGASVHPDMTVVTVTGQGVTIENLRVDGQQPVYGKARRGIYGASVSGLSVTDCVVHTAVSAIAYVSSTTGEFLRNEVYDFGVNLQQGGGIFLWNSTGNIGVLSDGNHAHDGLATGFIFHNSSSGLCQDNLAENVPLGYLSNGSSAPVQFDLNRAVGCEQGFQSIANQFPVSYTDNDTLNCDTGFTLFGLGAQLHSYVGNCYLGDGATVRTAGFYLTTGSVFGDSDLNALLRRNRVALAEDGIVLNETASSVGHVMNADLAGAGSANFLSDNFSQDLRLELCNDPVDATGNYFGSKDPAAVETRIFHQVDDPALGLVTFTGLNVAAPYCKGKVSSAGCVALMSSTGIPSATSGSPFLVRATFVLPGKGGFLVYGVNGASNIPFLGGILCARPPVRRASPVASGGIPPPASCSGSFVFDMNVRIQSGVDPNLVPGAQVSAQYVYRDGGVPGGAGLSDALQFVICP